MVYCTLSGAPFVPSRQIRVDKMIELANLQPNDRAIDMGSGDGASFARKAMEWN